ncbi:hypothetical protein FB639_004387 [Coemansia asiatica]|nr:hypothetical protein FB639_004387 [Coemansia asiatica]
MSDNGGRRSEYQLPSIKTLTGSPPLAARHAAQGYPLERPVQNRQGHQHHQYGQQQQQLSAPPVPGGHGQYYAHHHQQQHHSQYHQQQQQHHHHSNSNSHTHGHSHQSQTSSQSQQLHTPATAPRMESVHGGYAHISQSHEYRGSYPYSSSSSYMSRPLETPVSAPSPLDHYSQSQQQGHSYSQKPYQKSAYAGYGSGHHGQYPAEPMRISPVQGSSGVSGMARTQPQVQPGQASNQHHAQVVAHAQTAPSQGQSPEYPSISSHPSHRHSYYQQQQQQQQPQYSDAFARAPAPRIGAPSGPFVPQPKQRLSLIGTCEPYAGSSVSPHAGSADLGSKPTDATGSQDGDQKSDAGTSGLPADADEALLKRRKRNAQSAARLRERRKTREQELTASCASLESQIQRLQEELHDEKKRAKNEKSGKTGVVEERVEMRRSDSRGAKRTLSATTDGEGDSVMVEAAASREGSKKRSRPIRELDQVRLDDLKGKIETLGKLNQQVCVNLGVLRQEIQRISQAIISQKDHRRD